jgi:hypothetical protein
MYYEASSSALSQWSSCSGRTRNFGLQACCHRPTRRIAVWCVLLGLQPMDPQADPQLVEARHLLARKQQLLHPETGTLRK